MNRWRLLWDDLKEIPVFLRMGAALRRASPDGTDTLGVLLRQQAQTIPDRVLLRFEDETLSFGEFNALVNAYTHVFRQAGISRGEPVALMMENSPALLAAEGAIAKTGAIGALINTHLSGEPLLHVLKTSGARHVFADAACMPQVLRLPESVTLTTWAQGEARTLPPHVEPLDAAIAAAPRHEPELPDLHGRDIFLYIYTSGTTGFPKAAIVRHTRFTMAGLGLSGMLGLGADDVIYAPLPLYHGESNFVGFSVAVRTGGGFASRRRFSAGEFLSDVRTHGATAFVYVGELCRYLLRQPPSRLDRDHHLRLAVGAGLRPDIWETFQQRFGIERIVEMYGCTEGNVALMNRHGRAGSVGRPHPFQHDQVRLAQRDVATGELRRGPDGWLIACADDEPGELLGRVRGGATMAYDGYTDRQASEAKLVRDAFRKGDCYFRSGDVLRRDNDGYYYFVDRSGDTFRWKGENVATQEVAECLNGTPGVTETNVYGVEIPGYDGRAGMAAVVLEAGHAFDPAALYIRAAQLPAYARPLFIRLLATMEVTGTLKQRKTELREQGYDPERITDPLYVRDDATQTYVPLTPALLAQVRSGERRL